jgi:hypothetical protein
VGGGGGGGPSLVQPSPAPVQVRVKGGMVAQGQRGGEGLVEASDRSLLQSRGSSREAANGAGGGMPQVPEVAEVPE